MKSLNLDYNNTTWTAPAMAISTATAAPILGKLGDVIGIFIVLLLPKIYKNNKGVRK